MDKERYLIIQSTWRNGDILEQQANNRNLFKRYSKLLYTIANGNSPYE